MKEAILITGKKAKVFTLAFFIVFLIAGTTVLRFFSPVNNSRYVAIFIDTGGHNQDNVPLLP